MCIFLKKIRRSSAASALIAAMFCFSPYLFCADSTVLESKKIDSDSQAKSSILVGAAAVSDKSPTSQKVQAEAPGKATVTMTPRLAPSDNAATKQLPVESSADLGSIFKKDNPHAATPQGHSPFIHQTGQSPAGYEQKSILSYGKAKGQTPPGKVLKVRKKG